MRSIYLLKGEIAKRDVLCLLDTGASHNFITRKSAERMELQLEELKAPIEVHFAVGVPHPTTSQANGMPLELGNWRGKVDLLVEWVESVNFGWNGLHFENGIHHPKECAHRRT
jgi:hypothetical protein